jgi:hypothetical protein
MVAIQEGDRGEIGVCRVVRASCRGAGEKRADAVAFAGLGAGWGEVEF